MNTTEETFKTKKCFEIIFIRVVAGNKDCGLLGINVLEVNTTKLINSIEVEENNIILLRGYRVSIHLKKNHHQSYMKSKKLPIHI